MFSSLVNNIRQYRGVSWIGILVYLLAVTSTCQAIMCYECWNARSDEHCRNKGKVRLCEESETSCQTTERVDYVYGRVRTITKRCKQAKACQNNYKQNRNAKKSQCRYFPDVSVCRCCCTDDLCNFDSEFCNGVKDIKLLRDAPPKCRRIRRIKRGRFVCSNSNQPGSTCWFRCNKFNDLRGPGQIQCRVEKLKAFWSDEPPCCSQPCPPHGNMDLVFAVDSSVESENDWEKIKQLLKDLIRSFIIGPKASRIGIVMYNEKVSGDREIYLSSYNTSSQLTQAVNDIPVHKGSKRGTRTGQLLKHVSDVSFSAKRGNRKRSRDILIVLTSGPPMKEKSDPEITAKVMRDDGIEVITVGVGSYVDMKQLRGTAGFKKRVIEVPSGFDTIGESKFREKIIELICGKTCV